MAKRVIIAIDLGGTNLKVALLDLKYKILDKRNLNTQLLGKKEGLLSAIGTSIDRITQDNGFRKSDILGVGLGLPGPVDAGKGIVHFFPNIPGWKEVKLKTILQKRLKLPVFLDNDAKLMALAEYVLGNASGSANALCVTLGTGVGGGLILNKKLYRGSDNAAGELGHLPINENGPACNCGGIACLEAYIGNNRIKAQARKIFGYAITLEEVSSLAAKQNKKAKELWGRVGRQLGCALSGIVNLLNLDVIVIGGGVSAAGPVLFDTVKETLKKRAMKVQTQRIKVLKAKLGSDAGLIGAAIMVREGVSS
ncbi:MAG TPA: ROK family protein [Candidatus Margulisiibacteriota bacterium]|nr:ROK family protein [Candidatus Margulisiibacteriota bacterium]